MKQKYIDFLNSLDWEKCPLIPTIAQDIYGNVLMLAFSSKESLWLSLDSGLAHYFSRSRNRIWKKGEESSHFQHIQDVRFDCDKDSLLFVVRQDEVACHTGEYSCFYRSAFSKNISYKHSDKLDAIDALKLIIESRATQDTNKSYTALLLSKGDKEICKKIIEEAGELALAIRDDDKSNIIYECADVIYHTLVGLYAHGVDFDEVYQELSRRFGISGIEEKHLRK